MGSVTFAAGQKDLCIAPSMGWFKDWFGTRYYALLYGHRDDGEARAWVEVILARWHLAAGSRVLDMACGRGRHARWFSEAEMAVTGIDISQASIEEARKKVPGAHFVVHDIREPFAQGEFHGACCLFTSIGYFEGLDDERRVFDSAFNALRPGGHFVVDFMNTHRVLRDLVPTERLEHDGIKFDISRSAESGSIVKRIRVHDHGQVKCYEERVRALGADVLDRLAVEAGFVVEDRTDGPVPEPFDRERSNRFVLWLRKPGL